MEKLKFVAAVCMMLTITSQAQSSTGNLSTPLFSMVGIDAGTQEACQLSVMEMGYEGAETPENFYATVLTSYAHDDAFAPPIKIKAVPQKEGVLAGTADIGQDQIVVFLTSANLDLSQAKGFNLKWLHGSHFHTNRCDRLQLQQN